MRSMTGCVLSRWKNARDALSVENTVPRLSRSPSRLRLARGMRSVGPSWLVVATSLSWFGHRYHWTAALAEHQVELDRVFEQDVFDFRATLDVDAEGKLGDQRQ